MTGVAGRPDVGLQRQVATALAGPEPDTGWRWAVALAVVLALHAGGVAYLSRVTRPPLESPEEAVPIELLPAPAPPLQQQAPPEPDVAPPEPAAAAEPTPIEPPPPDPAPAETMPPEPPPPDPMPEETKPPEPPPEAISPEPPPPEPPHPAPPRVTKPVIAPPPARPTRPRPTPAAPMSAEPSPPKPVPTTPAQAAPSPAAASPTWQARLLAHLNRHKRYPPAAQMRHREGTAMVTFQLMPDGAARAIRLRSSAGSDLLDEEALALIARAQPLPVPDAGGGVMEVTVPVQFQLR